jgi:hypothetical protein
MPIHNRHARLTILFAAVAIAATGAAAAASPAPTAASDASDHYFLMKQVNP